MKTVATYTFLPLSRWALAACAMLLLLSAATLSSAVHAHPDQIVIRCPPTFSSTEFHITRGFPEGCVQSECDYFVGINPSSSKDLVDITLEGKAEGWVAVGFSRTPSMYSSDVMGCSRHTSGLVTVINTWNADRYKFNTLNEKQDDICRYEAGYDDGRLHCSFSRTSKGSNFVYDVDLSDDYYLLFGMGQTPRESFTGGFTFHLGRTPVISDVMMNPMTGAIVEARTTSAEPHEIDHTAPVYSTASVINEATQEKENGVTTEPLAAEGRATDACPSSSSIDDIAQPFRLTHRVPAGCDQSLCDYFVGINTNSEDENLLDFTLEGSAEGWVAIGFSKTPSMLEADVLGCNVYAEGRVAAIDTWNSLSPRWNILDDDQLDMCLYSAQLKSGNRLRCRFSRTITGSSSEQDLNLDGEYYFLFGRGQSAQMLAGGGFSYHERVPVISSIMINPVQDSDLSVELALVTKSVYQCPTAVSNSSFYRISNGFPKGCDRSECEYFIGIDTNPEDDRYLDFSLEGNAEGWVAVGFSDTPSMVNSDVLGCIRYDAGLTWVIDTWNPDSQQRTSILDETQIDICIHSMLYHEGRLHCTFSRVVVGATSETDLNLRGDYYILFGSGNRLQNDSGNEFKGFTRHENTPYISVEKINPINDSTNEIEVIQEVFSPALARALTKSHGILMIIAWPILAGTAIYFSAFMKPVLNKKGEWHYVHSGLMLSSAVLTVISIILIIVAHLGNPVPGLVDLTLTLPLTHFIVGITVATGQAFNILVALFRCKPSAKFRWIYNILHGKLIGYVTTLLSLANIALGIYLFFDSGYSTAFGLFLVVAIVGVVMYNVLHLLYNVVPRLIKCYHKKDEQERSLLSINEKYADTSYDNSESPLAELKSVLDHTYRHHFGTLVLVLTVVVPINIAVCVFIAIK